MSEAMNLIPRKVKSKHRIFFPTRDNKIYLLSMQGSLLKQMLEFFISKTLIGSVLLKAKGTYYKVTTTVSEKKNQDIFEVIILPWGYRTF